MFTKQIFVLHFMRIAERVLIKNTIIVSTSWDLKCRAHFWSCFYSFSFVTFYLLCAFIFLRRKLDIQGRFSQVNWIPHRVEQNFFCSACIIVNRNSSQRFLTAPNQSHTGHEQYHMNYTIGKFLSSVVSIYCCI